MKKLENSNNGKCESSTGFRKIQNSNRQVLLSLPKFLALTEQEKSIFFKTLSNGRVNVETREFDDKGNQDGSSLAREKSDVFIPGIRSAYENYSCCRISFFVLYFLAMMERGQNSTRFDALTENEKYIFFATLKNASGKKKDKIIPCLENGKGLLNVAVNVISKDKATIKRKLDRRDKRIPSREDSQEQEDRFLLSILGRREEQDESTKTVSSASNALLLIFFLF